MKTRHIQLGSLAVALFAAWAGIASAVPVQIQETNFSFLVPEGFEEVPPAERQASDTIRFFVRRDATQNLPATWLTIERSPAAAWESIQQTPAPPSTGTVEILGHYTEPWNSLDISVLSARLDTNLLESIARIPLRPQPIQVKLKSQTLSDQEMAELMRTVLASVQARRPLTPESPPAATSGWTGALVYLLLASLLLIVAFAKR